MRPKPSKENEELFLLASRTPTSKIISCSGDGKHTALLGVVRREDASEKDDAQERRRVSLGLTGFLYLSGSINSISSGPYKYATGLRLLDPTCIYWAILRRWLHYCVENHIEKCEDLSPVRLPSLRLIDCRYRKLVLATDGDNYLALSYVWGGASPPSVDLKINEALPDDLPRTIEHSITVADNLGIPYLWVDRYCIPQHENIIKHDMIRQMHRIYQNAQATIVTAAGKNPDHGLPGVSNPRTPQPMAIMNELALVSTLPEPRSQTKASEWMSRAWTYQEAIISKRLFFFRSTSIF